MRIAGFLSILRIWCKIGARFLVSFARIMDRPRLKILVLTPFPPSPPTYGAQRRVHGLLTALAKRHDISCISLVPEVHEIEHARLVMLEYCKDVVLVPVAVPDASMKRLLQLRSIFSPRSFVRGLNDLPVVRNAVENMLTRNRFDIVNVEFPFFDVAHLRGLARGQPQPRYILDEHNIEFDVVRQQGESERGMARAIYNKANLRKVRREEIAAWQLYDAAAFCSNADAARASQIAPTLRSAVVPNAVDLDYFRPRPDYPPPDGRTLIFFGALNYFPNVDGLHYFMREVWPLITGADGNVRLKIVGPKPPPEIVALRSDRVEVTGMVEDLRPHLSAAALSIVPLRIGGGTRLKVLEAMAMARPIVSTTLGAEGIAAEPGKHLQIADDPKVFAAAVGTLLHNSAAAERLGQSGRALVEARYSWDAAALAMEGLYREALSAR